MILIFAEEAMIDIVFGTPMLTTLVANTNGFNSKTGSSYNSQNNHSNSKTSGYKSFNNKDKEKDIECK